VSVDLMFGTPLHENVQIWNDILIKALSKLQTSHISLYQLTMEKRTKMYKQFLKNEFVLPNDEKSLELYEMTKRITKSFGLDQYEVSNFAKPGNECIHNIHYWKIRVILFFES